MLDITKLSNEELKKRIDQMESDLKNAPKKLSIDKFTEIDDLLRQNIAISIETNKRLDLIAQLLYAQYTVEGGQTPAQISQVPISDLLSDDYKTIVRHFDNDVISGNKTVFEVNVSGILAECKFQSSTSTTDNKTYGVKITSDKDVIYNATWTTFESRNKYETDMTCYEDTTNSYYILLFKNIAFLDNLKIEVYNSSATFTNIYIKYHKKGA